MIYLPMILIDCIFGAIILGLFKPLFRPGIDVFKGVDVFGPHLVEA
jgi:hypothetical protein